ncbi:zinc finger protein 184 [Oryzias melastigma]|uniref:zinc finger protein 184 n=1 Tax=Oryzias melastigma TaxID=30732 RepID=UPI000CF7CDD6|nr:zinc finger protein 184 [Oryzias melastigma]
MSSLQSLREFICERLAAAAEEIFRHCEGTIIQYEEELCRQRRLLGMRKPQFQLQQIDVPQHHLRNRVINSHGKQEEEEEEEEEPEPPPMMEEQEAFCISQVELKQEVETFVEIPTYEEHQFSEADLNYQQSFNVTDSPEEESSSTDGETDPQRKRRGRRHVQSVAGSHMSESQLDVHAEENTSVAPKRRKRNRTVKKHSCEECGRIYTSAESLKHHMRTHTGETSFPCAEWDKSFRQSSQTGEKCFSCTECSKTFRKNSHLTRHMLTHTGEKPFSCTECSKSFRQIYHLKYHMLTHTQQKQRSSSSAANHSSPPPE